MMRVLPAPPIAQLIRRGAPVTATLVVSQLTTGTCDVDSCGRWSWWEGSALAWRTASTVCDCWIA